jgi:hypothetical protein
MSDLITEAPVTFNGEAHILILFYDFILLAYPSRNSFPSFLHSFCILSFILHINTNKDGDLDSVHNAALSDITITTTEGTTITNTQHNKLIFITDSTKIEITKTSPPTLLSLEFPSTSHVTNFIDLYETHVANSYLETEGAEYLLATMKGYRQRGNCLDALIASLEDSIACIQ